jgi:diguanylate cyclase (GGDEF)-like protein/PAS domain S-box-containing protein
MSACSAEDRQRLEREIRRLRHELQEAVHALPHLRQMVQFSGDLLILAGAGGRILEANGRLAEALGVPQHALYGQLLQQWVPNPGQVRLLVERLAATADPVPLRMELDLQPLQGEPLALELEAHPLLQQGEARWTLALRDISLRRQFESSETARQVQAGLLASLGSSEARYRALVSQLADGLGQIDSGTRLLFANPALHCILAVSEGELEGRRLLEFLTPQGRGAFEQIWGAVLAGQERRITLPLLAADGRAHQVEMTLQPPPPGETEPDRTWAVGLLVRDVTDLTRALDELTALAFHDPLTGLVNLEGCRRELEPRLAQAGGRSWLVLWLDLDGFRRVNHSYGREAGDGLLQAVANGLQAWAGPSDLLARLGGDEFALVRELPGPADDPVALGHQAEAVLGELRAVLSQLPVGDELAPMALGFSAGYSLAPLHGDQVEALLQGAATALSRAREVAPGTALAYEPRYTTRLRREMALEARLHRALGDGALRLVYQPQYDGSGCLLGAEALLRWDDPIHGAVPPARFVALAERTNLIHPLGQWVLEEACRQLRGWLDEGLQIPRLAVNLSPRQFELTLPPLVDQVTALLARHRLPAGLLELEITETCILPAAGVTAQVHDLAALGLRLSLDDFGTGYSSLSVLNRLPLHKLKIDRSFIQHLETSDSARTIVRTALAMGRGLGLETLAEGLETAGQLAVLEALGCDAYQGYWFSHPLEVEAFEALLGAQLAGSTE